ncbi:phytanoyl-CoA dioxygenase family protein [Vreelandella malpeensis]|uniref:Phytanoyl-CoA dioxygenase family protein n=1 Tax=Vreelandella malpeensis TaxID=1172368 RepID=A0ABS8DTN1_9GAMM|nr:phytanoyl-CoA dioxygenase family protein [Halomonas malpeensis]MCB8889559.1 phytanoyl-CoA dioxygenase family protein [Halomonas malpeensis]
MKAWARYLVWGGEVFTGSKSFKANPILGSARLNRWGLHAARVRLAYWMTRLRMAMLAPGVPRADRRQFNEQGFVLKENYLSEAEFQALVKAIAAFDGEIRECCQGDARTHRILLTPEVLNALPEVKSVLEAPSLKRLFRYCAGHARLPICHIENVLNDAAAPGVRRDPQKNLHVDTFQPTMKFWLYLEDVTERNGPFIYVPGSHRPHRSRLEWEHAMSLEASGHTDHYTASGSFRVGPEDAARLGTEGPRAFCVKANTLLIANTFGIHARGDAEPGSSRLALWGMSRTNPFLPLPGLGFGYVNRLQYRVLQRMRHRDDEKAAARGTLSSWHRIEQTRIIDDLPAEPASKAR